MRIRAFAKAGAALSFCALLVAGCGEDPQAQAFVPALPDLGSGADDGFQVRFVVQVPEGTVSPPVHVVGDFQNWNPEDPSFEMVPIGSNTWSLTTRLSGAISYKYARGSWDRVEKGAEGEEVEDRTAVIDDDVGLVDEVQQWAGGVSKAVVGDVRPISGLGRRVWIYLPPSYANSSRRYPILYLFDGQNLFDPSTSFAGEWGVDETMERLIEEGAVSDMIVVGLDNGGENRIAEYTPWSDPQFGGGEGVDHLEWVLSEVMPKVALRFRILEGPEHTSVGGSSLGGLMAIYAAFAHPDVFGTAMALSPSIWWSDREILRYCQSRSEASVRVYADMGTAESSMDAFRALRQTLTDLGFEEGTDLWTREIQGGQHNESAWRARLPEIFRTLFPR